MDYNYLYYKFPTYGYLTKQFTKQDLEKVSKEIQLIKNNFHLGDDVSDKLAGQIDQQYKLENSKNYVEEILLPFAYEYDKVFNYFNTFEHLSKVPNLVLEDLWVNFQKKYEYNPPHSHSGVLSFVIWLNVPYNSSDEARLAPGNSSHTPKSGNFEFFYINNINRIASELINIDKEKEFTAIIFPSTFIHQVYPFYTSDDYRISVAGNFKFKID